MFFLPLDQLLNYVLVLKFLYGIHFWANESVTVGSGEVQICVNKTIYLLLRPNVY